ncbi:MULTISPECIES: enoyl-CoA-hydratase DpgB [unclassified Streptomyces]|uniref:enoyl-CoA-hydratase DpgB n=1 Tax=unclassified Streptomyces TaxID=2593676 RepID=UPI0033BC8FAD
MRKTADLSCPPADLALTLEVEGARTLAELTAALAGICDQAESRKGEHVIVVLRLAGSDTESRAWPGPADIQEVNRWERAVRRLERLPAMNIAVGRGACGGPALDLLLAADFRIAAPDLLLRLPVNDGHFWPGMALYRLVQHLGLSRARQIVLWGGDIPVTRAQELGLIDQVADDISAAVHTATALMGRTCDQELAVRRRLLLEAASADYDDALGVHLAACDRELRRLQNAADAADDEQENSRG